MSKTQYEDLIFPKEFLWGSATSAHQVEGNNNKNHWWLWEQKGGNIADGSVSGVACDQYNRYKEDIQLMKELSHNAYRFSIEWSRIEPEKGKFDAQEVEHYRDVLNTLIDNGITPMVTLHHFTNPIWLQKMGAWENPEVVDLFERYTVHVAEALGDLVPFWNTINEPMIVALIGYLVGVHPPNKKDMAAFAKVAVNLLKSHGKGYHAIHRTVKGGKHPQVGIVKTLIAFEPFDPNSDADKQKANSRHQLFNLWFLNGITTGVIGVPLSNNEEIPYLKGSSDFFGVNYYTRELLKGDTSGRISGSKEKNDMGWEIYPEGLYNLLIAVKKYNKPIYITENGICTTEDERRSKFLVQHLISVHQALQQGVDIRGYLHWSLMDNFEWNEGFAKRFGLVELNYETQERKPRPSAYLYQDIITGNKITKKMQEKYL
ncbi:MAG: glycoside hydrolase family 1 protein [Candidatus Helarchaeota archaeon]|nr:glycoside hydrolase family 1 protein [Candidatus Helarchaeota archaeon]